MPDRRVADRREGGAKKITVSLSTFIFVVLIIAIFIATTLLCIIFTKTAYNSGYNQAINDITIQPESYEDEANGVTSDADDFNPNPDSDTVVNAETSDGSF